MIDKPYFDFASLQISNSGGYNEPLTAKCPVCGKTFCHTTEHIYHVGDKPCCSWACHRSHEKAEEEKKKIVSEADYDRMKKRIAFAEMKIEQAEKIKASPAWEAMTKEQRGHVNSTRRRYKDLWGKLQEKVMNTELLMEVKQHET